MPRAKADQTLKKAAQKLASASRAGAAAVKKAAKGAKTPAKAAVKTATTSAKTPAKASAKAPAKTPTRPAAPKAATKAPAKTTAKPATKTPSKAPASKAPAKVAKTAVKAPAKAAAKPPTKAVPAAPAPAPVKKAVKAKKHVLDKFELEQRDLLNEERAEYVSSAEALKAEADQLAAEMEPGDVQFDEESGEGGTTVIDRERDLALSAQARLAVEEIDHALAKLAAGTYGPCENCGQPIPRARLKALPHARLCVACKSGGLSRR